MRRRSKSPQDSLDLLLDTMCNAFGGIVLIAILVALLIQSPGESDATNSPTGEEALQIALKSRELAEAEKELEELRKRREENREILELSQRRNQLAKLLEAQQQTESLTMVELNDQLAEILNQVAQKKEELADMNSEITLVLAKIENVEREQEKIKDQMKNLISSRMAETRPPELRDASGTPFNLILRYGEIFQLAQISQTENGKIVDLEENPAIRWEGDWVFPIEGRGLKLDRDRAKIRDMLVKLRSHNEVHSAQPSKRYFITSFIYGDSFHLVSELRQMIDEVGKIKDGWNPRHPEIPLGFSTSGSKSQVN